MVYKDETLTRCVKVEIKCDICRRVYEISGLVNLTTLRIMLKSDGWSYGKKLKCPKCSGKAQEETK